MQGTLVLFLSWKDPLENDRLPTLVFLGFPSSSAGKESACNTGDLGLTWVGKIPWKRERLPTLVFWYLAWRIPWPIVHGVTKSQT